MKANQICATKILPVKPAEQVSINPLLPLYLQN